MKFFYWISQTKIWESVFRTKLPISTNLDRALVIFNSLSLHIHPVKVRKKRSWFTYTFTLG